MNRPLIKETRIKFSTDNFKLSKEIQTKYKSNVKLKPDDESFIDNSIFAILKLNNITRENNYDVTLLLEGLYDYLNLDGAHKNYKTWTQLIDKLIKLCNDKDYDLDIPDPENDYIPSNPKKENKMNKLRKLIQTEIRKVLLETDSDSEIQFEKVVQHFKKIGKSIKLVNSSTMINAYIGYNDADTTWIWNAFEKLSIPPSKFTVWRHDGLNKTGTAIAEINWPPDSSAKTKNSSDSSDNSSNYERNYSSRHGNGYYGSNLVHISNPKGW